MQTFGGEFGQVFVGSEHVVLGGSKGRGLRGGGAGLPGRSRLAIEKR